MSKVAVTTGAAGGLGKALIALLLDDDWTIVGLDLPSPSLEALQIQNVETHACDLTNAEEIAVVCQQILSNHQAIDLVIHCAGITHIGNFESLERKTLRRVMEINFFATVEITTHLLSAVRKAKGTHLAISSVAGFSPLKKRTAYAASKHALEGFFNSLRSEESVYGVSCLIAAPSFIATNSGNAERQENGIARPGSASDGFDTMSPDDAATVILKGYHQRRSMITVGRIAGLSYWLNRFSPRLYERIMTKKVGAGN
ncbi:SDR family NAD(P)-dependent oxidoreductase [Alphaproteobacteria bacterium]|nr:SDR family NAD(P)-dependent oxidoreductase [Alphaproteobacteria bacterium]